MPEPLRVILADDHEIVRSGLRMVLEAAGNIEIVAEAGTADDAVRYVLGHKPDVLVLDLNMPGTPSLETLPQVNEASPDTAVVVLTMQSGTAFAREALRAGVRGYVLKESAGAELVQALRTAADGGTYLTPSLGARLATEPEVPELPDGITSREAEVLSLLALGHTNAEIGDRLHLSRRTVESHRASLQSKTGCATRAELVRYALDHQLLEAAEQD
ncbi:response regulator [Paraconexibacter sp.]|uniref:response regulator n=1 Tax=Paraconexibacter sp. TaxID=2949640 RepID=UPI003567B4D8